MFFVLITSEWPSNNVLCHQLMLMFVRLQLLFLSVTLYVYKKKNESKTVQFELLANDCLVYQNNFEDRITFQSKLKQLEALAQQWGMKLGVQKCHILSIRNKS